MTFLICFEVFLAFRRKMEISQLPHFVTLSAEIRQEPGVLFRMGRYRKFPSTRLPALAGGLRRHAQVQGQVLVSCCFWSLPL